MRTFAATAAALALLAVPAARAAGMADAQRAASLELIVLGSGGPGATGRAGSGYLVLVAGKPRVLVDAGPGTFVRLGAAAVPVDALDIVLLTHLHADHAGELPGIVKARAVAGAGPVHFQVFGPRGSPATAASPAFPSTSRFIELLFGADGAFAYLRDFAAPVSFSVTDLPRAGVTAPEVILSSPGLTISAVAGHHGDAPAVIYRIDSGARSIVFSGDVDASGLPALAAIAAGATMLVFDTVVLDPPGSPEVLYSLHSPPGKAGALAAASRVQTLLLSHLSPQVEEQRAAVTRSIRQHYRGEVRFARDGLRLPVR